MEGTSLGNDTALGNCGRDPAGERDEFGRWSHIRYEDASALEKAQFA
jgi:hypothetical protein